MTDYKMWKTGSWNDLTFVISVVDRNKYAWIDYSFVKRHKNMYHATFATISIVRSTIAWSRADKKSHRGLIYFVHSCPSRLSPDDSHPLHSINFRQTYVWPKRISATWLMATCQTIHISINKMLVCSSLKNKIVYQYVDTENYLLGAPETKV